MKKYEVKYIAATGDIGCYTVEVEAATFAIDENGMLIFRSKNSTGSYEQAAAFASGQWVSVQMIESKK